MALFGRRSKPGPGMAENPSAFANVPPGEVYELNERISAVGREMLDKARSHKSGLLSKQFYQDKLMDWSMKDHAFKVEMFRFVDTFPTLTTPDMVHEHLVDSMTQEGVRPPPGMDLAIRAGGVAKSLAAKTISSQITNMAHTFIAGTDAKDALPDLAKLWKRGLAFSVDLLGEACVSDDEADMYQAKYLDLVENLVDEASGWKGDERLERDHLGVVPRVNVSIKVSSLCAQFDPIDPEGAISDFLARVSPILEAAKRNGVLINFDMEHFELKDLTIRAFMRACETHDFEAGIAIQAYLKSGVEDAERICEWAKRVGRTVTVRLVKGAYWDYETIHAEQNGWPCPVWGEKWQTDACFEQMVGVLLDATPRSENDGGAKLALGSHNVRSIASALIGLEERDLPRSAIELQMLHGMADQLKHAASEMGLRVREYVPVGEMIPGMAYLVRRLLENTSNESWLKAGFLDEADPETLLADPNSLRHAYEKQDLTQIAPERHELSPADEKVGDGRPFYTEPTRDFADAYQREAFAAALATCEVPEVKSDTGVEDAMAMVERAHDAFPMWRDKDPYERSRVLALAAAMMRERRDELSGIVCKESRKPWREADGDVCEAIDFMEYYARLAPALFAPKRLGKFIGELDQTWHTPKGVALVVSPWNFPLAICTGMTSAALVTGNTVIVKPAEQSAGIAKAMFEILRSALWRIGVQDAGVLHFCPAPGETTGAALVRDPRVSLIAFTGSKAVGLNIVEAAGVTPEEQRHVKKVVCEMGGKNAIIVDTSADLDEAVLGVRYSAFGFQGQKCSACSRCIVVDPAGPEGPHMTMFLERLGGAARALVIGHAHEPGTDVAPVIDSEAHANILKHIERARADGLHELVGANDFDDRGIEDMVVPHVFTGVTPEHALAQQEVFGPVLAVMHASSYDEALKIANDHPYKLTGGVFTRRPAHIEQAKREFRVGNLYINRGCTGALVGRHPFGGFGMSGIGSKAGGEEYLYQFVDARACAENTMRRGFAPEL